MFFCSNYYSDHLFFRFSHKVWTPEDFYTAWCMPWIIDDNIHIKWNRWEFDQHFMDLVPEEGVSRLVSSKRSQHRESIYRRGLAFQLEHGFMDTPEGRMTYAMHFLQIKYAVQQSANMGVVIEALTCQAKTKEWERKHGYWRSRTITDMMNQDKMIFAILQRMKDGAAKLDSFVNTRMNLQKGKGDTWLVTAAAATHIRFRPENTTYAIGGPPAIENLQNADVAGAPRFVNPAVPTRKRQIDYVNAYQMFKKSRVYQTEAFHVYGEEPLDLMQRQRQIGTYGRMVDDDNCSAENYSTARRETRIYDERADSGHNVGLVAAIRGSNVFDTNGQVQLQHIDLAPRNAESYQELHNVFFLRQLPDGSYTRIERYGDIRKDFIDDQCMLRIADTIFVRLGLTPSDISTLNTTLETIRQNGSGPIEDENIAAKNVSWAANQGNAIFVSVVNKVVNRLKTIFGSRHPLINPKNASTKNGTAAQAFYENALMPNLTKVWPANMRDENVDVAKAYKAAYVQTAELLLTAANEGSSLGQKTELILEDIQGVPSTGSVPLSGYPGFYAYDGDDASDPVIRLIKLLRDMQNSPGKYTNQTQAPSDAAVADFGLDVEDALKETIEQAKNAKGDLATYESAMDDALTDGDDGAPVMILRSTLEENPTTEFVGSSRLNPNVSSVRLVFDDTTVPLVATQIPILANAASEFVQARLPQSMMQQQQQSQRQQPQYGSFAEYHAQQQQQQPIGRLMVDDAASLASKAGTRLEFRLSDEGGLRDLGGRAASVLDAGYDPLTQALFLVTLFTPFTEDALVRMAENNIRIGVNFLLLRPHCIYNMARGIKMLGGGKAGNTYGRDGNFILGDDAQRKMHIGHYTAHFRSIVRAPENVYVTNDIYCNSIHKFMGVEVYDYELHGHLYRPDEGNYPADMFICMVPGNETDFPKDLDCSGRFRSFFHYGFRDIDELQEQLHYSTAPYYNVMWKFSMPNYQILAEDIDWEQERQKSAHNTWCSQGRQGYYDPRTATHNRQILRDQGHWGQPYAGVQAVRNGQMANFDPPPETGSLNF